MTDIQKQFLEFCKNEKPQPFVPTQQQQRAIFEKVNVVPAGAGSGKTTVLAHRFLYLVMSGLRSDQILTMTFTKDATAGMKKKIYSLLSQAGIGLEDFSKSTITTTDSFCSEIAKSACSKYGISATFKIEDDASLEEVAEKLTDEVLKKHEDDRELQTLFSAWSISNIRDFFKEIADKYVAISNPVDFTKYKPMVLAKFGEFTEEGLGALINDYLSFKSSAKTLCDNQSVMKSYLEHCGGVTKAHISALANRGKEDEKAVLTAIKSYIENLQAVSPESLELLDYMAVLLKDFQEALFTHKRKDGLLTYHDVLLMAIDILRENKEIRDYYRSKFKAIMVDEFQDNNEDNKNLVYLLASSDSYKGHTNPTKDEIILDKVFMVGDEKQSIYMFRNADVSVFKRMSSDFGSDRVACLSQNYRSERKLIEIINNVFRNVFDNAVFDYEASYAELQSDNNNVEPRVVIYTSDPEDKSVTGEAEAFNTAKVISDILTKDKARYQIPDGKSKRDPKPSDIAVLLKVSTHQLGYEKAFKAYGIPYEAVENKTLTVDATLNDFYNIIQLAVWGTDDGLAWLSFKNSPLCAGLDEDEAKALINQVRDKIAISTLTEVVSYIWFELGYRFFILRNEENLQNEEHFDYIFSMASKFDEDEKTVVDFLEFIRPLLGQASKIKDFEIQRESTDGVKIMSIHKSKGLEFPIVIVPDMHSGVGGSKGFNPKLKMKNGVVTYPYILDLKKNPMIEKEEDEKKELAETKRVLYVAATRAQYHLVFSGIARTTEGFSKSMFGLLLQAVDSSIETVVFDNSSIVGECRKADVSDISDSHYQDTFDFKFTKLTNAITNLDADKETAFDKPLPTFECDKFITSATDFGTYVHSLLEMKVNGVEPEGYGPFEADENRETIRRDAMQMCDSFINSKFFKSLSGYEKKTEQGFFYFDSCSNQVMEGIADLLCIGENEIVIVDYKTDKFKDPSTHKDQLDTYTKAMAEKYGRPVVAYLFYVRSGEEVRV